MVFTREKMIQAIRIANDVFSRVRKMIRPIFKLLLVFCFVLNFFFFFFFCILQGKANEIEYIKSCHFDLSSFFNEGFMMVNRTKH